MQYQRKPSDKCAKTITQVYELLEYKCRANDYEGGVRVGTVEVTGNQKQFGLNILCLQEHVSSPKVFFSVSISFYKMDTKCRHKVMTYSARDLEGPHSIHFL